MIGKTISHYKILEKLGEGGMGIVYKAHDTKLDRDVALKFLPPHLDASEEDLSRFQQEAKAISALNHPHIETIYDVDEIDDQKYLVLEYIPGGTLKSKLKQLRSEDKTFSISEVLDYGIQLAEGLGHAHRHQIIHRDVKTDNILLTEEGKVKLTDFGLAKLRGTVHKTKTGSTLGTVAYMSPEQIRGEEVDQRSDLWSLGVVLYELVTSHLPFPGEYEAAVTYGILNEDLPAVRSVRPEIPAGLEKIIDRCLEKDKTKRYQQTEEIIADLRAVQQQTAGTNIVKKKKARLPFYIGIGIILLAVIIIGYFFLLPKTMPVQEKSIAVLPFVDMSPQKDQEYFCDGITEELINRLSNIQALRVPARTSAFVFKGKTEDIQEIGSKLKVQTVLEGSVRKADNELRITAQLINVANGYHLWSETYDRKLREIFSIQDEIALEIINTLKVKLLGEVKDRVVKRYTDNTEAYDSYMRGMWLLNNKATEGDWRKAIHHFERAIELDPNFSLAFVGLAGVNMMLSLFHLVSADEAIPEAKKALEQALKIDHELPEALTLSGAIKLRFEYNLPGSESDIKKALELNPNYGLAHLVLAHILLSRGQMDKAIEEASTALELDLLSLRAQMNFAWNLYQAGRYDDALKQCKKSLELDPEYPITLGILGLCDVQKSLFQEAIDTLQKAVAFSGNSTELLSYLAYAYVMAGNLEKAHEILRELDLLSKRVYVSKLYLASVQAALGYKDKAFESLELAYQERDGDLIHLRTDPRFSVLRSDPRYKNILNMIGVEK
jgi:serine/threonine protein kinase/Flp pilus assembly protein TadD